MSDIVSHRNDSRLWPNTPNHITSKLSQTQNSNAQKTKKKKRGKHLTIQQNKKKKLELITSNIDTNEISRKYINENLTCDKENSQSLHGHPMERPFIGDWSTLSDGQKIHLRECKENECVKTKHTVK